MFRRLGVCERELTRLRMIVRDTHLTTAFSRVEVTHTHTCSIGERSDVKKVIWSALYLNQNVLQGIHSLYMMDLRCYSDKISRKYERHRIDDCWLPRYKDTHTPFTRAKEGSTVFRASH
jgi:hypothetical protein